MRIIDNRNLNKNRHSYTEFGKEVKIVMIKLGLNNRQLAKYLGYKESTLCDVLKGRNCCKRRIDEIRRVLMLLTRDNEEFEGNIARETLENLKAATMKALCS